MRTCLLAIPFAILLSACGSDSSTPAALPVLAPAPAPAISAAQLAQIDELVQAQMSRAHVPGLSLVVTLDGKPVLEKGYGLSDTATGAKVTPDTVFQIGSITKQFTASAIMLLAQDGKLHLDDPITRYLPTAPRAWGDITIRHLMNHTSGLARDFPLEMLEPLAGKPLPPLDTLVTLAVDVPRHAPAGAAHEYSNVGYHLLGFVVEKVGGLHFAELLRQRVFTPLGMSTAGMISAPTAASASGYQWNGSALVPASGIMTTPGFMEGEGGLRMSARDLARWDAALLGGWILSRESLAQMHAPTRLSSGATVPYGLGWVIDEINRHPFTWHNGQLEGFRSQFVRHTSEGLSVIVLTNATDAPVEAIAARVSAIVKPQLDWMIAATDPEPKLGQLLRTLVDEVGRGALNVDERFSPQLRAALTPDVVAAIHADFGNRGAIERFGYVDDVTTDGVTLRRYLVRTKLDTVLLVARLDGEGRLAALSFTGP